jgi:hypothetical protein
MIHLLPNYRPESEDSNYVDTGVPDDVQDTVRAGAELARVI